MTNQPWDTPSSNLPPSPDLSPSDTSPSRREYQEEQRRLERAWYDLEELGGEVFDEACHSLAKLPGEYVEKKEQQVKSRETARQRERRRDTEMWEEHQMFVSGTVKRAMPAVIDEEEEIGRVHLLVS